MTYTRAAKRAVNRYLRQVGRALAHLESAERRDILGGLRTHIAEALQERGSGPYQTEDIAAVLATLETPGSYRANSDPSNRIKQSHRIGRLAFYLLLGSIGLLAIAFLLGAFVTDALWRGGLIVGGVGALCALGVGIAAWRDPYGKATIVGVLLLAAAALLVIPMGSVSTGPSDPQVGVGQTEPPSE